MAKTQKLSDGLADIEKLTEVYAAKRDALKEIIKSLNDEIDAAKRKRMSAIRKAAIAAKDAHAALKQRVSDEKAQFEKPRTRLFHGIKVGFRKLVGSLTWNDTEQVVKLIEKHFPEQAEVLIKVEKKPVAKALEQLPAADLKRLGVTVGEDSDEIVIKPTDSEIEKVVDALLKDDEETE